MSDSNDDTAAVEVTDDPSLTDMAFRNVARRNILWLMREIDLVRAGNAAAERAEKN